MIELPCGSRYLMCTRMPQQDIYLFMFFWLPRSEILVVCSVHNTLQHFIKRHYQIVLAMRQGRDCSRSKDLKEL